MLDCTLVEIDDPLAAQILKFICSNEKQTFNATVFISFSFIIKIINYYFLSVIWHLAPARLHRCSDGAKLENSAVLLLTS